mmetsp:Transcript_15065/g.31930  ORF Transcript_15065/g.31930 Transcript_15065/m.31930 type:complete len:202 (-) Transcript_15065:279-884(-)
MAILAAVLVVAAAAAADGMIGILVGDVGHIARHRGFERSQRRDRPARAARSLIHDVVNDRDPIRIILRGPIQMPLPIAIRSLGGLVGVFLSQSPQFVLRVEQEGVVFGFGRRGRRSRRRRRRRIRRRRRTIVLAVVVPATNIISMPRARFRSVPSTSSTTIPTTTEKEKEKKQRAPPRRIAATVANTTARIIDLAPNPIPN